MSSNNFLIITPHPLGGFAVLAGTASSKEPLIASESSQQFTSLGDAMVYANGEDSAYGVQVDSRIIESLRKDALFESKTKRCRHTGDVWFDREPCECQGRSMHTRCIDCDFAMDGCPIQVDQMLDTNERDTLKYAIAKINLNHVTNHHVNKMIIPRAIHDGSSMPDRCTCEEIVKLIAPENSLVLDLR